MPRAVDGTKHKDRRKRLSNRRKVIGDGEVPTIVSRRMQSQKPANTPIVTANGEKEISDACGLPEFQLVHKLKDLITPNSCMV